MNEMDTLQEVLRLHNDYYDAFNIAKILDIPVTRVNGIISQQARNEG